MAPLRKGLVKQVLRPAVEPDEDVWRAYVPELEAKGAATWGRTQEEALANIREVAQLVIESMLEDGEPILANVESSDEQPSQPRCEY